MGGVSTTFIPPHPLPEPVCSCHNLPRSTHLCCPEGPSPPGHLDTLALKQTEHKASASSLVKWDPRPPSACRQDRWKEREVAGSGETPC